MKKCTAPLIVLLTVLLLISLVFLPALVGVLQDAGFAKQISSHPLHSIAPYISEKGSGLRFEEKLTGMLESEISAIVPALASMTQQQVRVAVEEGIQPYVDAGIIQTYEHLDFHAEPYVAISWQDEQQYFLFWSVSLVWIGRDSKHSLSIRVDDETGAFLNVEYFDPYSLTDRSEWNERYTLLDSFARIWLEQAGLWDRACSLTSDYEAEQFRGEYPDFRTAVYEIADGADKSLYIYFCLNSQGEYMMWIEYMPE